jgi:hypothetical protein
MLISKGVDLFLDKAPTGVQPPAVADAILYRSITIVNQFAHNSVQCLVGRVNREVDLRTEPPESWMHGRRVKNCRIVSGDSLLRL